jgi:DNA processing protein
MPASCVLEGDAVPACLRDIPRPCRRLFVEGALPDPSLPRVAIVGTRAASASGRRLSYEIARELGRAGVVVVSGLARGIDAAAHQGALDGGGITVAFLGNGVDVIYPRSSRLLAAGIPERGALVSEYPPGSAPRPGCFVERNRLVAAYTQGTLVVEGGLKSGALITAGLAVELGRELWAVPGDPCRDSTRGSNRLLRDGAGAVLDGLDLLAAVGLVAHPIRGGQGEIVFPPGLSAGERAVLEALMCEGCLDTEALSRITGLEPGALLAAVSCLELAERIRRDGEGFVCA